MKDGMVVIVTVYYKNGSLFIQLVYPFTKICEK